MDLNKFLYTKFYKNFTWKEISKVNVSHFHVAIIHDSLKKQEISSSNEIIVRLFNVKQKFLNYLESDSVDLIFIKLSIIDRKTEEICNDIRKKSGYSSVPIVLCIDKVNEMNNIIRSLSLDVDLFNCETINLELIKHYSEKFFEKIIDSQNPNLIRYQFKYNQYNLIIEPKKILTLLISVIDNYIQSKDLTNAYIGMAAHDIRNPLSVILNATQFFLEKFGGTLSEEGNHLLSMICNSSNHILQILEEMLDISKLDSAKMQLNLTEVNFRELIEECYAINKALAKAQQIQLLLEVEEKIPKILCDGFKIQQVVTNLLTNAIKFSKSNTVIEIIVFTVDEKLYITVEDHGLGISVDDFSKVFHEFGRTKTKSVHGEMNTGLGLAIAKKIMDLHGGDISFTSKKDKGSTFTITLPLNSIVKEHNPTC